MCNIMLEVHTHYGERKIEQVGGWWAEWGKGRAHGGEIRTKT